MVVNGCEINIAEECFPAAIPVAIDRSSDENDVRRLLREALAQAGTAPMGALALPELSKRAPVLPLTAIAKISAQELYRRLRGGGQTQQKITLCIADRPLREAFSAVLPAYLGHIINVLQAGPFSTVDAIIEMDGGILLIQRTNPPFGWALPGGFVDYGETLEEAVIREVKEETNLTVTKLQQLHTYSDPARDPRFHTIGTVFAATVTGTPKAGDDAGAVRLCPREEIKNLDLAFDHKKMIEDYLTRPRATASRRRPRRG